MENEPTAEAIVSWENLQSDTEKFSERILEALKMLGITEASSALAIDHACIRLSSAEKAEQLVFETTENGQIISLAEVNGRPIYIVELKQPVSILGKPVQALEIPHPKPEQKYQEGWEHVEFVLPEAENTPEGIEKAFFEQFPNLSKDQLIQQCEFKVSEPHSETDQLANPTISLKINGIGLKFHAQPIQKVVGFKT